MIASFDFTHLDSPVIDEVNGLIGIQTANSDEFYPEYDANDPWAAKYRGYYFNGLNSYMEFVDDESGDPDNNAQLVLSPEFTISMWVYPEVFEGTIMIKQDTSFNRFWQLEVSSTGYPTVTMKIQGKATLSSHTCNT